MDGSEHPEHQPEHEQESGTQGSPAEEDETILEFDYIKSQFFRVIHVSGAFGGANPEGKIQVSLFNERHPIPKKTFHKAEGENLVEIRKRREARRGIVREVEVSVIMDLNIAKTLKTFLELKDRRSGGSHYETSSG